MGEAVCEDLEGQRGGYCNINCILKDRDGATCGV